VKIKVNMNTLRIVLLIALLLYSLSQQSWGGLISGSVMWRILFIGCVIFGITTLYKFIRTPYLYTFLCVVLMAVVLLFNNQNLANGSNGYELVFSEIILFTATAYKEDYWIKSTIKVMLVLGVLYAVITLLSFASKDFYDTIIYPFIASINDTTYMGLSTYYSNGFTAHYSFNGMYIAMGVCIAMGVLIPGGHNKNVRNKGFKVAFVVLMVVALLLTNKRAHILFTGAGAFLAYYIYNSNKPAKRITKIVALLLGILLAAYFLNYFMPNAFGFLQRFEESASGEGGITNGRYIVWGIASMFVGNNTVFGKGWFSFYHYYGAHVHNVYLQLFVETGVIGLSLFIVFFLNAYVKNILLLKESRRGFIYLPENAEKHLVISLIYQTFFLLYGITGTCLYEVPTLVPYILFTAMTEHYWYIRKHIRNLERLDQI